MLEWPDLIGYLSNWWPTTGKKRHWSLSVEEPSVKQVHSDTNQSSWALITGWWWLMRFYAIVFTKPLLFIGSHKELLSYCKSMQTRTASNSLKINFREKNQNKSDLITLVKSVAAVVWSWWCFTTTVSIPDSLLVHKWCYQVRPKWKCAEFKWSFHQWLSVLPLGAVCGAGLAQ